MRVAPSATAARAFGPGVDGHETTGWRRGIDHVLAAVAPASTLCSCSTIAEVAAGCQVATISRVLGDGQPRVGPRARPPARAVSSNTEMTSSPWRRPSSQSFMSWPGVT
jgi:hypothetical protein